jgi:hypothetical protein
MSICAVYFIGSLIALTLAMAFFLQGVMLRRRYEDEEWRRELRQIDSRR